MKNIISISLLFIFLFAGRNSYAQFTTPGTYKGDSTRSPKDSLKKKFNPSSSLLKSDLLFLNLRYKVNSMPDPELILNYNEPEKYFSFMQSLGQTGKPYLRYRYGLPVQFTGTEGYTDRLHSREDLYIIDPEKDVAYYDTRTPLARLDYTQGPNQLAALRTTLSQNFGPLLNFTGYYARRQCKGFYSESLTDHSQLYLAAHTQSANDKYHSFANATFNFLQDELSGGFQQLHALDSLFEVQFKSEMSLESATYTKKTRSVFFSQYYRFIDDTLESPHRFTIFHSILRDEFINEFTDGSISYSSKTALYPIYPTLDSSSNFFWEYAWIRRWKYTEGFSYRLSTEFFRMHHEVKVINEQMSYDDHSGNFRFNNFTPAWTGGATLNAIPFSIRGEWKLSRTFSTLFKNTDQADAHVFLGIGKEKSDYETNVPRSFLHPKDSLKVPHLRRPIILHGYYTTKEINPSLMNVLYHGYPGNLIESNRELGTQFFTQLRGGLELKGKDFLHGDLQMNGSHARLDFFQSTLTRGIWYLDSMKLYQMAWDEKMSIQGIELSLRLKFWKLMVEGQGAIQEITLTGSTDFSNAMQNYLPQLYGNAAIYFHLTDTKIAKLIRFGFQARYNSSVDAWLFDPASQIFYSQQGITLKYSTRLDVFSELKIKRAFIVLRFNNLLQLVNGKGYYSTPYYGMQPQQFLLGVNWTFFD